MEFATREFKRSVRVSDREVAYGKTDVAELAKGRCRRDVFMAIADEIAPGRYVLEVREESRPDRDNLCTELRCIVQIERKEQQNSAID